MNATIARTMTALSATFAAVAMTLGMGTAAATAAPVQTTTVAAAEVSANAGSDASVQVLARTKRDRQCRAYAAKNLPSWFIASGHRVGCMTRPNGYVGFYQGAARTLWIDSSSTPTQWRYIARQWGPSQVPANDRITPSQALSNCRAIVRQFSGLQRVAGVKNIVCTVGRINNHTPDIAGGVVLGLAEYKAKRVQVLVTTDNDRMRETLAHELGHFIAQTPSGKQMQAEISAIYGRDGFESGDYIGRPTEGWAESFARAWTHKDLSSVQPRISPADVEALLRKYSVPVSVA